MPRLLSSGFLVNDPEHAPFGAPGLRGITPARVGVLLALSFLFAFPQMRTGVMSGDYRAALWILCDRFGRGFACAIPMFVLVIKTEGWTRSSPARGRIVALVAAVVAGAALYSVARAGLRIFHGTLLAPAYAWQPLIAYFVRAIVIGGTLTAILYFAARERDAERRLHGARLAGVRIELQLAESRLSLLQTQIEPHFLFNSLAIVKRLYENDRGRGRELLGNLAGYLRAATLSARRREIPLAEEIALAQSFLGIFQVRMGGRLRVNIAVPPTLGAALVPPMTLGTLVENAIKHGIGPLAAGGTLDLFARREGDDLVVGVADDGAGFKAQSGCGIGLANIRARLETLFGARGSLELEANAAGGVTATMRLPYRLAAA